MLVSVIVCTFKREEVLCNTLLSLFAQTYTPSEIIVVDQTPQHSPQTTRFLEEHQDKFQLINIETPGLPNARNVGIQASRGEIVIFCDDDVELKPNWIDYLVENFSDPRVGAVGGRILERGHAVLADKPNLGYINLWGRPVGNFSSIHRAEIKTVRGGSMAFPRAVLDEVGYFDPNYIGNAIMEESDLSYRVWNAGYKVIYEPRAELLHLPQPSGNAATRSKSRRQWYHNYFHNGMLFVLKNKSRWAVIPFVATQFLIAVRQGIIKEKSLDSFTYMLAGIGKGARTFSQTRTGTSR